MVLNLQSLRHNRVILRQLRWDVTPEFLFKPRFVGTGEKKDIKLAKETNGYMFYIDYMGREAKLMLMRTIDMMSTTVGEVEGVPQDILQRAVKAEGVKPIAGMYPINREIEDWLKAGLGLKT